MDEFWSKVRNLIVESFNKSELSDLIFDEGINPNALGSSNVLDLTRELLLYIQRNYNKEKQFEFYNTLLEERPYIDWPDWPEDNLSRNKTATDQPVVLQSPQIEINQKPKSWLARNVTLTLLVGLISVGAIIGTAIGAGITSENKAQANEISEHPSTEESNPATSTSLPSPTPSPLTTKSPTSATIKETATILPTIEIVEVDNVSPTPQATNTITNGLHQVITLNKTGLFTEPDSNSVQLRFVGEGETLSVLRKERDTDFNWLYVENNDEYAGWVAIKSIQKVNKFSWVDVPTGLYASDLSSETTSDNSKNRSNDSGKVSNPVRSSCSLQVAFKFTPATNHEISWSNLPEQTNKLYLQVNRINPPEGDLFPLVEPNRLDRGAIQQGVFHVPRTRFSERSYDENDQFQISLVAIDSEENEICSTQSTFTWDGRQ